MTAINIPFGLAPTGNSENKLFSRATFSRDLEIIAIPNGISIRSFMKQYVKGGKPHNFFNFRHRVTQYLILVRTGDRKFLLTKKTHFLSLSLLITLESVFLKSLMSDYWMEKPRIIC
jgi:hypothetical protein